MKYSIFTFLPLLGSFTLLCGGCPEPEVPPKVGPPTLEVVSPFDLEESPKGISVRKTLVLKNTGDSKMRITDFKLKPDNGVFLVGISKLPLNIDRNEQKEITVTFRPTDEQAYTAELTLDYNHDQVFTPEPIELEGLGISNLICLSCQPPPEPECSLEGEASIYFEPTTSTDCENENGICSYLMFEEMCESGLCDEDTKQCPLPEDWDAGETAFAVLGAGQAMTDAGQAIMDSGWIDPDLNEDDDSDGILNDDDDFPNHHNADLQFIIDLISNSGLAIEPLNLGNQVWQNGRLIEANFRETQLSGPIPTSIENPTQLTLLDLALNSLTGNIPTEIGALQLLEELYLSFNELDGTLPSSLFTLSVLKKVDLGRNENLGGPLPAAISGWSSLEMFFFGNSNLTGNLPEELGTLTQLTYIGLDYNKLTGNIPQSVIGLPNLNGLSLNNNLLSGLLSESLCSAGNAARSYSLSNNAFCPDYPACLLDDIAPQNTDLCTCEPGFEITDLSCIAILCSANQSVFDHSCESCPDGTTNEAGDDASGADTNCAAVLCDEDHRVVNHLCEPCPDGTTNAAGDNASANDTACDAADVCDGVVSCPVNSTCTPTSSGNVGATDGNNGMNYTCECNEGFQDNDNNDTCMPDCSQLDCLNAIACDDSSGTAECLSDELSCSDLTETTNGTYYIDPDGIAQGEPAFLSYCEMETDGGGWTAFFAGYNGDSNVFAHFENNNDNCPSESSQCLRQVAPSVTTGSWFAASCGEKMIKFQINEETLALFQSGQQSYWEMLSNVSAIKGTVSQMPDRIWSGDPSGAQGNSWVLTKSDSGASDRNETFSSSYSQGSQWDYCDGVADSASPIYLFYR